VFVVLAGDALGCIFAFEEARVSQSFGCLAVALGGALVCSGGDGVGLVHGGHDTSLIAIAIPGRRRLGRGSTRERS
jgi:hypothetical protein